ncbi:trypsin-like peptidase domain-containing protein [Candidatus Peregrinibacteria bacterium]|nr:trypsin-like peptidase domain-containing protein [Candidatus Peregrinibacteria bacterium]
MFSKEDYVRLLVPVVLVSVISGAVGGSIFTKRQTLKNPEKIVEERNYVEESDSIDAIQKVVPAVVSIVAAKDLQVFKQQPLNPFAPFENDPFFRNFGFQFQQPQQQQDQQPETKRQKVSGGTGFIIESDGLAITNKHVVADTGADYSALTKDGKEYDVEVISRDTVNDLAVIQLHEKTEDKKDRKTGEKKDFGDKPKALPAAKLGDSSKLKVGQRVFAIGNARGEYENSVTSGIISAVNREIQASDQGGGMQETLSNLIQTDAAINFGNSGGPLINLGGEVVGINTAIDASAQGIGFAIPVNQFKPVLESVKKYGKIVRPILGVMHTILNKDKAKELKLDGVEYGALITGDRSKKEFGVVPGSPAEKAGLKLDDVIVEVDGEKVTEDNTLQGIVQKHAPGDKLKLKVWRAGNTFEVTVTLEERQEEQTTKQK